MRGHIDAEALAEYREDLLSRRAARRVAAHLRECAQCARLDAQLAGVSVALARVPAPPMPDALTARITAALATEAAARSARDAEASPQPAPGSLPEPEHPPARRAGMAQPRWRGFGLRTATAAAVAVVVAGGGYGVLTLLTSGGGSGSGSAGGSGVQNSQPAHGGAIQPGFSQQQPGGFGPNGLLPNVVHSGTDYRPGRLRTQVGTVLARSAPSATGAGRAASSEPARPFGAFHDLPACVHTVTGGSQPKLVDIARYRGQPAAVIVAGVPTARELRVWVVGTRCSGKTGDVLARTMVTTVP